MTRNELVERMARAILVDLARQDGHDDIPPDVPLVLDYLDQSTTDLEQAAIAALRAIEEAGAVVVPREATGEMVDAVHDAIDAARYVNVPGMTPSEVRRITPRMVLAAMLVASPYAEKPQKQNPA